MFAQTALVGPLDDPVGPPERVALGVSDTLGTRDAPKLKYKLTTPVEQLQRITAFAT